MSKTKIIFFTSFLIAFFVGVVPASANVPYVPKNLTLAYTSVNSITLTWTAPVTTPIGYHVYRDSSLIATVPVGGPLTWSDTMPAYGIYAYAVRAYNGDGDSDVRIHRTAQWIDPDGRTDTLRQWGITWHFDVEHDFGQFANGDFWVQGPVSITSIDPACAVVHDWIPDSLQGAPGYFDRTINGAMIDPVFTNPVKHGYDSGQRNYDASLNVACGISVLNPLIIPAGHSLISSISNSPIGTSQEDRYYTRLRTAAVLTILASPAPEGSFRPPYDGTDKTIYHNKSDLDYSLLQKLAIPSGETVAIDDYASRMDRVFLDNNGSDFDPEAKITPDENMDGYGRDVSVSVGNTALVLNLNFSDPQKEKLLINFVQMGIDLYGVTQNGMGNDAWHGWGGHFLGRKLPVILAGIVLHDNDMKNVQASFAEDTLTYYYNESNLPVGAQNKYSWTGSKVLYKFNYFWNDSHYNQIFEHKDPTTWTKGADTVPYITDDLSEDYRTCCTAKSWVGIALSVRLMGAMPTWNNPSFFDYMDRWMYEDLTPYLADFNAATGRSRLTTDYRSAYTTLSREMWKSYRNMSDTEPPTMPQNMAVGTNGDGSKHLTWNRSGDNVGGVGYHVYRNGGNIATVYTNSYDDQTPGSDPVYTIAAFDWTGNASALNNDIIPPAAPSGLSVN